MLVTCFPLAIMIAVMINGQHSDIMELILIMSFSGIPILNPLMTILLISAYRKSIMSWLSLAICYFQSKSKVLTIIVKPMTRITPSRNNLWLSNLLRSVSVDLGAKHCKIYLAVLSVEAWTVRYMDAGAAPSLRTSGRSVPRARTVRA